jgi:hypothetical protein
MLTSKELAKILNTNGGTLLDSIPIETVTGYLELRQMYAEVNVMEDKAFQEKFISYYKLSGTGVNAEFLERYFEIMENHKKREAVDIKLIRRAVYGAQPKKKLTSAQFSLLSRMANLIDDTSPLYDNAIAALFNFDPPTQTKLDSRERLNVYLELFREVNKVYTDLIEEKMIRDLIMVFKIKLKKYGDYPVSPMKRIDFMVAAAARLKNDNKLI